MGLDESAAYPRYTQVYGFLFTVLLLALLAAFRLDGALAWTVGLIYIAYDTVLFCFIVAVCAWALGRRGPAAVFGPLPAVGVVIPARNERSVLEPCLKALWAQSSEPEEVVVVDDGSTDETIAWLSGLYGLSFSGERGSSPERPGFSVLRRPRGGKARALNAGWRALRAEIIVTLDADTVLEPDAILELKRAFAAEPALAAGGGVLLPRCGKGAVAGVFEFYQTFEYIRSFFERFAWMSLDMLVLVSGAFAAFRREQLEAVGGFLPESPVEDYEIIYRLYRRSYDKGLGLKVRVLVGARAVTDAPASTWKFLQQRSRWFAGFLDTLHQHRDLVDNPAYGRFGQAMLPIKMIDALKPIYGLLAFLVLIVLLATGFRVYRVVLFILALKLLVDLLFYCAAFHMYHRWTGKRASAGLWLRALVSTLTEPYSFQLLRHLGAVLGSVEYLSGRIGWAPQRDSNAAEEHG